MSVNSAFVCVVEHRVSFNFEGIYVLTSTLYCMAGENCMRDCTSY